jgi:hypothetical protein
MNGIPRNIRHVGCILLTLAIVLATVRGAAAKVEVRMLLDTSPLGDTYVYDVDPAGGVLVLTRDNIYDAGGREYLFGEPLKKPGWLTFAGGKLLFMANGGLFAVAGKMPAKLLDVPLTKRMAAGDGERIYIAGVTAEGKPLLFLFKEGVGYKPLLELDTPVDAMALARGTLFFSAGKRIYTLREDGEARLFAHLPGMPAITSLSVDESAGILYFSDDENLYAVRGNDFVVVRHGLGGMLRWRGGDLYVLSRRDHALFRLRGLAEAFSSPETLVPLKDPCLDSVMSLFCRAEEKRALLKTLAQVEEVTPVEDVATRAELAGAVFEHKAELDRVNSDLEKQVAAGVVGIRWGGGQEPQPVTSGTRITTAGKGVGVSLWNGSELRVGPETTALFNDCLPAGHCRQTLERGLLHIETLTLPNQENAPASFSLSTGAMNLSFSAAQFAVYAAGGETAIVVMAGRVDGVTPKGEKVTIAAGETLELKRDEMPGVARPAEMQRLNRWWEKIR